MNTREKRIAIVTGAVIGLLALDAAVVSPLLARLSEASAGVEQGQRDLIEADRTFQNALRAKRRWRDLGGNALQSDASGAESLLLNRVRDWAQSAGLTLTSLKPERDEREQGFQKVTIRATGTGTTEQAMRFLYAVQTGDIPARVGDVQLTSRPDGVDDLSLSVGIATIYLPPEPPAGTGARATPTTPEVRR